MQTHQSRSTAKPHHVWVKPEKLRLFASGSLIAADAFGNALGSSLAEANSLTPSERRNLDYDDPQMVSLRASRSFGKSAYEPKPISALTQDDLAPLNFTSPQELLDGLPKVQFADADAIGYSSSSSKKAPAQQWVSTGRIGSGEGHMVDRPSEAAIVAAFKRTPFDIIDGVQVPNADNTGKAFQISKAFRNGNIVVEQEGNTMTLVGKVVLYTGKSTSSNYEHDPSKFENGVDQYWNNLEGKVDGITYRTRLSFETTTDYGKSNLSVGYTNLVDNRANASQRDGSIWMDTSDLNSMRLNVAAHEFGHSFFGLGDAYIALTMPNGYKTEERPAFGFEKYLMANSETGKINGSQLKELTLKFLSLQQANVGKK